MAAEVAHGFDIVPIVTLLGAAVVAVPIFKKIGLGTILGYLAAGLAIGPFGLGLFTDPASILHVAELGVVLFLFIIGLEMQPSRLWQMRGEIFGLGVAQVAVAIAMLTAIGMVLGYPFAHSFVAGTGFVLTSTAIVMQTLQERRELDTPSGRKVVSILLLEDLAIVPLLAVVTLLAPSGSETTLQDRAVSLVVALGAVGGLVLFGRYALDPLLGLLGRSRTRELLTASALLVVLGSALAMQSGGLSMALGAFLAGVLLSESSYRHQLEVDIEPFRGVLLGLFFIGVGMSLNLEVVASNWQIIGLLALLYANFKMVVIYGVARLFRSNHREAGERSVLMAQGGEFAFVLYAAAASAGIIDSQTNDVLTATIILSMIVTPPASSLADRLLSRTRPEAAPTTAVPEEGSDVLLIGMGRFGQVVAQPLLERGCKILVIETDTRLIAMAQSRGMQVYFGDGDRLDILQTVRAGEMRAVVVAVDDRDTATRITRLLHDEFPDVPVLARAYDRVHARELTRAGATYQIRETFESAMVLADRALAVVGATEDERLGLIASARARDCDRLRTELEAG